MRMVSSSSPLGTPTCTRYATVAVRVCLGASVRVVACVCIWCTWFLAVFAFKIVRKFSCVYVFVFPWASCALSAVCDCARFFVAVFYFVKTSFVRAWLRVPLCSLCLRASVFD